ncbi:MAG: hypothetical protein OCU17_07175 [Methanophagales archaeon]|nr:hypothetical protein [Methanophagales archaeon]
MYMTCTGAIILFFLTAPYQVHVEEKMIGNAMELRMNASEIDAGRE